MIALRALKAVGSGISRFYHWAGRVISAPDPIATLHPERALGGHGDAGGPGSGGDPG
jgi:hypothetical protein